MANSRNLNSSVALASQAGNYNFSQQLCKIYNKYSVSQAGAWHQQELRGVSD